MKTKRSQNLLAAALLAALAFTATIARAADPLPSWNDGPAKQSILTFVEKVTKPGSPDFVPVPERIPALSTHQSGRAFCMAPLSKGLIPELRPAGPSGRSRRDHRSC